MTLNASHAGQAHRYNSLKGTSNPPLPPWLLLSITIHQTADAMEGSLTGQVGQVQVGSGLTAASSRESQEEGVVAGKRLSRRPWVVQMSWPRRTPRLSRHGPYVDARRCLSLRAQQPRTRGYTTDPTRPDPR